MHSTGLGWGSLLGNLGEPHDPNTQLEGLHAKAFGLAEVTPWPNLAKTKKLEATIWPHRHLVVSSHLLHL